MSSNLAAAPAQITVSPHDPVIVRDGRPFTAGSEGANRARSLAWPYPSTSAGAVRTLLGRLSASHAGDHGPTANPFHDHAFIDRLKEIKIWGPLPLGDDGLYVSAPLDFLVYESGTWVGLRPEPLKDGEGCNLPHQALWPIHMPHNEKPGKAAAFWPMEAASRWLVQDVPAGFQPGDGLEDFPKDERIHVRIDPASNTSDDSQLFSTQGLVIPDIDHQRSDYLEETAPGQAARTVRLALLVQAGDDELAKMAAKVSSLHPFGGERRLARFHSETPDASWQCPSAVREGLGQSAGVRMLLATPAIFKNGWLPGWLDPKTLEGSPPGSGGLRLRLRGGCTGRWRAISGWDLQKGRRGPKPVRRLTPAGSVYFLEVISGSAEELAGLWLNPVSDQPQDQNDGFGLALWGVWDLKDMKGGSLA